MKTKFTFGLVIAWALMTLPHLIFAQDLPTDTVCGGTNAFYKVLPTEGSTYDWFISGGGTPTYGVDNKSDSIRVDWAATNKKVDNDYVKVIETNQYGRSGDTIHLRVVRYPVPTGSISGSDTLFDGNTGTEKIKVTLTGTAPWSIIYNDGKTNVTIDDIGTSPYTIKTRSLTNPPVEHNFTLVSVTDESGCPGSTSGSAKVIVSPPIKTSKIIHN